MKTTLIKQFNNCSFEIICHSIPLLSVYLIVYHFIFILFSKSPHINAKINESKYKENITLFFLCKTESNFTDQLVVYVLDGNK